MFEAEAEDEDEEPALLDTKDRGERIGKYFGWHLRRQVAYDVWWLVWGIFLVCIIERTKLMDEENAPWFNLFRVGETYYLTALICVIIVLTVLLQSLNWSLLSVVSDYLSVFLQTTSLFLAHLARCLNS